MSTIIRIIKFILATVVVGFIAIVAFLFLIVSNLVGTTESSSVDCEIVTTVNNQDVTDSAVMSDECQELIKDMSK